jgi:hypothetical protein
LGKKTKFTVGDYTISGGVITVTGSNVRVDTEAAASSDDLTTINGGADGQLLILSAKDASHDVVLNNSGNLSLLRECTLATLADRLVLVYDATAVKWVEMCRSTRDLSGVGAVGDYTIATGAITITGNSVRVDTEGAAASDDLDTINGGKDGDIIVVCAANAGRTVVMKDATGNMQLAGDFSLGETEDTITLRKLGSAWHEISRSLNSQATLGGTYTPTGTAVANVTTVTPAQCQYTRVGMNVMVSGSFTVTATANSTFTRGRLTLPIASNLGSIGHCGGAGAGINSATDSVPVMILADTTNNEIEFAYVSDAASAGVAKDFTFSCMYTII